MSDTEARTLVLDLIRRGVLPFSAVLHGDVMVASEHSRHAIFVILTTHYRKILVKRAQAWQPESVRTLTVEATCYQILKDYFQERDLYPTLIPDLIDFDSSTGTLVIEYVENSQNLKAFYERTAVYDPSIGTALASALSSYHNGCCFALACQSDLFQRKHPWIFDLHNQSTTPYGLSGANAQLISILNAFAEYPSALALLREKWSHTALIHGDLKWENILLPQEQTTLNPRVMFIDWEMADIGDPLWDVGAVFQSYLSAWALASTNRLNPGSVESNTNALLDRIRPLLIAFWKMYVERNAPVSSDPAAALELVFRYCAARLIQTTFEHNVSASVLTSPLVGLLQLAANLFTRPQRAVSLILGN